MLSNGAAIATSVDTRGGSIDRLKTARHYRGMVEENHGPNNPRRKHLPLRARSRMTKRRRRGKLAGHNRHYYTSRVEKLMLRSVFG